MQNSNALARWGNVNDNYWFSTAAASRSFRNKHNYFALVLL